MKGGMGFMKWDYLLSIEYHYASRFHMEYMKASQDGGRRVLDVVNHFGNIFNLF